MLNETEFDNRFVKIINHKDIKDLQTKIILQLSKNVFEVFNKYKLEKKSRNEVYVSVNGELVELFSSIKNALCYCIFDRRGKYVDASRIIQLDSFLSSIDVHIEMHNKLLNKSKNTEEKLIYLAKLNEDRLKKQQMLYELESYLNESNYWQQNQYKLKTE